MIKFTIKINKFKNIINIIYFQIRKYSIYRKFNVFYMFNYTMNLEQATLLFVTKFTKFAIELELSNKRRGRVNGEESE